MTLKLQLFGVPHLQDRGGLLLPLHRKVLALLIFLQLDRNLHPRDFLADLLWPDVPLENAQGSLRKALSVIGKLPAEVPLLLKENTGIRWNPENGAACDLDLLQKLLKQDPPLLTEVQQLLPGPFLEQFSFPDLPDLEAFFHLKRQEVHGHLDLKLEHLAQHLLHRDGLDAHLEVVGLQLMLDPLREDLHFQRIETLLLHHRKEEAFQHFWEMELHFQQLLGTSPSRKWEDFQQPAVQQNPRPPSDPGWVETTRMVGRVRETREVLELCLQHPLVTLHGAGGVGKTRLARKVLQGLRSANGVWVALEHLQDPHEVLPTLARSLV